MLTLDLQVVLILLAQPKSLMPYQKFVEKTKDSMVGWQPFYANKSCRLYFTVSKQFTEALMVISLQSIWMLELFPRILQRLSLLLIHQQRRADIGTLRLHRYHADQDTSKKNSHFKAFRRDRKYG